MKTLSVILLLFVGLQISHANELTLSDFYLNTEMPNKIVNELNTNYGFNVAEDSLKIRKNYNPLKSVGAAGMTRFFSVISNKSLKTNWYTIQFKELSQVARGRSSISYKCDLTVSLDSNRQRYFTKIHGCSLENFKLAFFME